MDIRFTYKYNRDAYVLDYLDTKYICNGKETLCANKILYLAGGVKHVYFSKDIVYPGKPFTLKLVGGCLYNYDIIVQPPNKVVKYFGLYRDTYRLIVACFGFDTFYGWGKMT